MALFDKIKQAASTAKEKVAEEWVWSSRRCKIIDLCNM